MDEKPVYTIPWGANVDMSAQLAFGPTITKKSIHHLGEL